MTIQTFFKKIGRGIQSGVGQATKAFGAGVGSVLGPAAGTYALEAAPALLAFKYGGKIPGKIKNKPIKIHYRNKSIKRINFIFERTDIKQT